MSVISRDLSSRDLYLRRLSSNSPRNPSNTNSLLDPGANINSSPSHLYKQKYNNLNEFQPGVRPPTSAVPSNIPNVKPTNDLNFLKSYHGMISHACRDPVSFEDHLGIHDNNQAGVKVIYVPVVIRKSPSFEVVPLTLKQQKTLMIALNKLDLFEIDGVLYPNHSERSSSTAITKSSPYSLNSKSSQISKNTSPAPTTLIPPRASPRRSRRRVVYSQDSDESSSISSRGDLSSGRSSRPLLSNNHICDYEETDASGSDATISAITATKRKKQLIGWKNHSNKRMRSSDVSSSDASSSEDTDSSIELLAVVTKPANFTSLDFPFDPLIRDESHDQTTASDLAPEPMTESDSSKLDTYGGHHLTAEQTDLEQFPLNVPHISATLSKLPLIEQNISSVYTLKPIDPPIDNNRLGLTEDASDRSLSRISYRTPDHTHVVQSASPNFFTPMSEGYEPENSSQDDEELLPDSENLSERSYGSVRLSSSPSDRPNIRRLSESLERPESSTPERSTLELSTPERASSEIHESPQYHDCREFPEIPEKIPFQIQNSPENPSLMEAIETDSALSSQSRYSSQNRHSSQNRYSQWESQSSSSSSSPEYIPSQYIPETPQRQQELQSRFTTPLMTPKSLSRRTAKELSRLKNRLSGDIFDTPRSVRRVSTPPSEWWRVSRR